MLFRFGILCAITIASVNDLGCFDNTTGKINKTFELSVNQISDEYLVRWDSIFIELNIKENPFAILIYFMKLFLSFNDPQITEYLSLNEILSNRKSNPRSSGIATVAIMQKLGWDVQYIYNIKENYLGINFTDNWKIRKGNWVEKDRKRYYLKELDDTTPVGELRLDDPNAKYRSLKSSREDLKPLPLPNSLPKFADTTTFKKVLKWRYEDTNYSITVSGPKEQLEWTKNLPPSLFGMVFSGIHELANTGLIEKLKFLLDGLEEFEQVNFLLKFCQSESIFVYDNKLPIRSVTQQLVDGRNDCDGRSVFLYCLLLTVLNYSTEDIIFISWPKHLSLGLRPKTEKALELLKSTGTYVGDTYFVLDPAYAGDTRWGSKMPRLAEKCEIIPFSLIP